MYCYFILIVVISQHLQVYCSQFRTTDDRSAFTNESPADAIETHPNIKLLPEKCGKINGDRIIGGKIADLYEFPWMALISHRTRGDPGMKLKYITLFNTFII